MEFFTSGVGMNSSEVLNVTEVTPMDCAGDEKEWTDLLKVAIDAFVAPVFILIGLCGNFTSFVILGKIASKIRHMIKADEPSENGTLITILLLRALAVLDTFGLLLTPVPEACMLLYNFITSGTLNHLYYNPVDSIFPKILVWTIPCGLAAQTMIFWTVILLAILRVSLRTGSGVPSCCTRSLCRAGLFLLLVCLVCLANHAPSFQWYRAMSLKVPCEERTALTIISQTDTSFHLWMGKIISYTIADGIPFVVLFVLVFCLAVTFCLSRKEKDEPELVTFWDNRLHGAIFFISFLSCVTVGLTTFIAVYDICTACHDWFGDEGTLSFNLNWWSVLVAEALLVVLQSLKVLIYLMFLKPFRQICACKSDEVINEIGRTQYELHRYSLNKENTKL